MHTVVDPAALTEQEKSLLTAAAANRGALRVELRADTHGRAVCAGRTRFFDPNDRAYAQRFVEMLGRLRELQLLREAAQRDHYELTNFGWQITRKLRQPTGTGSEASSQ